MNNLWNDDIWFWWYDESVRLFLVSWYWPNFVMGNFDSWAKMGITLNGIRPNVSDNNLFDLFNPQAYNICKV